MKRGTCKDNYKDITKTDNGFVYYPSYIYTNSESD